MVSSCDAFYFVAKGTTCSEVLSHNGITLAQLYAWNSGIEPDCSGLWANVWVCVSTFDHEPTPTQPGSGVTTPSPLQEQVVSNCDEFYLVQPGETCSTVAGKNGITVEELKAWNPSVGADCSGLWADAYACVSVIGHQPTPVEPVNGVETPSPIQGGMTTSCNRFHLVDGELCSSILKKYQISLEDFVRWNPGVGEVCENMWDRYYVCVGVL
jgi:hypothetical protein